MRDTLIYLAKYFAAAAALGTIVIALIVIVQII
jgi:hypothetical protein